jgi:hypothetical protein
MKGRIVASSFKPKKLGITLLKNLARRLFRKGTIKTHGNTFPLLACMAN